MSAPTLRRPEERRRRRGPRVLTLVSLLAGAFGVGLFVHFFRTTNVLATLGGLPPTLLLMIPVIGISYGMGTLSWRRAFPKNDGSPRPPFIPLYTIRLAGEAINNALASAYVAGEPVKGILVTRYGTSPACGLASALTGKTTFILGEVFFLMIGVGFAVALFEGHGPVVRMLLAVSALGLLVAVMAILVQQRRLVGRGTRILKALRLGPERLWRRAVANADAIDTAVGYTYRHQRRDVVVSVLWATAGWLFGTVEVWAFLRVATPVENALAVAVVLEAGIAVAKGLSFFIPGSIGAQEGGIVWLFHAVGAGTEAGLAYAVFRRFRELVWVALGFVALGWYVRRAPAPATGTAGS